MTRLRPGGSRLRLPVLPLSLGLLALAAPSCRAADAPEPVPSSQSGYLSGAFAPLSDAAEYQFRATPASRDRDPDVLEDRVRGTVVVSTTPADSWSVQQTLDAFQLGAAPVITQTGVAVPRDLWSVETGAGYRHRLAERNDWSLSASVGSASDRPYHSLHEDTLRVNGSYRAPSGETNAWLFLLSYSNNRYFANNIPLPGVAYLLRSPEHGIDAMIGLPFFSVRYRPTPDTAARLSVFGPENVSAEWARRLCGDLQAYAGFDWGQKEWLRAGRADNRDRLFYDAKRWSLGVRFPLPRRWYADLGAGYDFDRRMYEDRRARSSGVADVEFAPAWSAQARLGARW